MRKQVMFIDDEKHIRIANKQSLELADLEVTCLESAEDGLKVIDSEWAGVVVCDIRLPQMDGLEFLKKIQEIDQELPVILITGHGDISMAVKSMQDGAYDFIEKPYPADRLVTTVKRALEKRALTVENRTLRRELDTKNIPGPRIIGNTSAMDNLRTIISEVADTGADILILGETGTGKELVARSLHEYSNRRKNNFVAINCGAVSETIIESELFGHEAGAFTDAKNARIGKFEHANGGTILLDEIESMPMRVQIHLLRILQERSLERLGSNTLIPLDMRVIAASKVDLLKACEEGSFRNDLYYRLNVVCINIPPLRDRREDISLLLHHFLLVASHRYSKEVPYPTGSQINALLAYNWPGNVRELRNLTERYVLLGQQYDWSIDKMLSGANQDVNRNLPEHVDCFERSLIDQALVATEGSIKDVLNLLGIPRKTLYDKMRKYDLDKSDYK
ncbi:MAG: sigma-54 dependent transcriptional regulator [Desulfotalea sp.]